MTGFSDLREIRKLTLSLAIRLHTGLEYLNGLTIYALYELADDYMELLKEMKEK